MNSRKLLFVFHLIILVVYYSSASHAPPSAKPNWLILPQPSSSDWMYSDEVKEPDSRQTTVAGKNSKDIMSYQKQHQMKQSWQAGETDPSAKDQRDLLRTYPTINDVLIEASTDETFGSDLANYFSSIGRNPQDDSLFQRETQKLLNEYDPTSGSYNDLCNNLAPSSSDHIRELIQNKPSDWTGYYKTIGTLVKYKLDHRHWKSATFKSLAKGWKRKMFRYFTVYQMTRTLSRLRQQYSMKTLESLLDFVFRILAQIRMIEKPQKGPRFY